MNIFSDKSSLVLRSLLKEADRNWVIRDFVKEHHLAQGGVWKVLSELRKKGFLAGGARGRNASSQLRHSEEFLHEWTKAYTFEKNQTYVYYTPDKNVLPKIKSFFESMKEKKYALALHTGANFITRHVSDPNIYLYLNPDHFETLSLELRKAFDLKELKNGGNIYLIDPYYKASVFFGLQKIKGYNIVSNLQLYLDLYHFPQRGREHAEYLLRILKEEGKTLGE